MVIFVFYMEKESIYSLGVIYRPDAGYWILDTGLRKDMLLIYTRIEHQVSSIFCLWWNRLFYKEFVYGSGLSG